MVVWVLFGVELAFIALLVAGIALAFGVPMSMILAGVLGILAVERMSSSMRAPAKKKAEVKR